MLVTGDTGFKGAWLSLLLHEMGATVVGVANSIPTAPSLFEDARLASLIEHHVADVRDRASLADVVVRTEPEIVFHLAAQSLVRASFTDPVGTWETNVLGTIHVLEACRRVPSVKAVVVATSDKCYENVGDGRPHREDDPLGGNDPYSSSKAAAEIAVGAWRSAFFGAGPVVATVRAGNVIGGGDWSPDRLVPDLVRAALGGLPLHVRNPTATRPWQDVMDCLAAYVMLAERVLVDPTAARAWNVGPPAGNVHDVALLVRRLVALWPGTISWKVDAAVHPPEAPLLALDSTAARRQLGWAPKLSLDESLVRLVDWYSRRAAGENALELTLEQIRSFSSADPQR